MSIIQAYKCNYCEKIYENKNSCKSHEYKCYFNPKTKSCVGCSFFRKGNLKVEMGTVFVFNLCLLNHIVIKKLKTNCHDFANKKDITTICQVIEAEHNILDYDKTSFYAEEYYNSLSK